MFIAFRGSQGGLKKPEDWIVNLSVKMKSADDRAGEFDYFQVVFYDSIALIVWDFYYS